MSTRRKLGTTGAAPGRRVCARVAAPTAKSLQIPGVVKISPLPPPPDMEELERYKNRKLTPGAKALLNFKLSKQRNREVQQLV